MLVAHSVIVVSPNPVFLELVQSLLRGTLFRVSSYSCYVEAQATILLEQPVLVTVAHQPGYASPWLFLRVLQFDPATRSIPALICDELSLGSERHQVARQAHYYVHPVRAGSLNYRLELQQALELVLPECGRSSRRVATP